MLTQKQELAIDKKQEDNKVIEIKNLDFYYHSNNITKQILFNINLTLKKGDVVIMKGPSGSGKTTLLTLMGALRSATHGSLKVFGKELVHANNNLLIETRRNIGYIFQAHNLLKSLTATQNVQMSMDLHRQFSSQEAKKKSIEMLKAVGLGEHIDYYPDNLSGGQKQRVAIARALVSHPKMVLADEPTAALDSKSGRDVVDIMQRLAKEQGCTILIVTHDDRILDVAERIIELEDGILTVKGIVLIVDDSLLVREMLSLTFKKAGYEVEVARDGQEAWEKLSEGLTCDLVICDVDMPKMDGLELLTKMQQDEKLSDLPVAMVTSMGIEKHRNIAAELGARAYFTKPYVEHDLLNASRRLIRGEVLLQSKAK